MNNKTYEMLGQLSCKHKIVSIYDNYESPENFNIGFIVGLNKDDILIEHIAPNGAYDGFILKKTSNIFQIGYDGLYQEKIMKLYKTQEKKHSQVKLSDNLMLSLLEFAKENRLVLSLELNDSGVMNAQGFISDVCTECLEIQLLTEYGMFDGISMIELDSITRIDCDTEQEQILKAIHS